MASTQTPAPLPSTEARESSSRSSSAASDAFGGAAALPVAGAEGVAAAESAGLRQLLLFAAGGRIYGCDISDIREIVPFRRCTRLPGAPAYVCGLINLRGTLVTVVDLAARLAGDEAATTAASREGGSVVLVEYGAKVVGVAVDQVRDVQAVAAEELEPVAIVGSARASDAASIAAGRGSVAVYHGSGQLDGEVVVVLDVHAILEQVLA